MGYNPSSLCQSLYSYGVVKNTLNKLINDVSCEIKSRATPFGKDDLKRLEETMSSVSTHLPDPEQLAINLAARNLVLKLKEVAYDIEDLLDLAATQKLEQKASGVNDLLAGINPWQPRPGFVSDLKPLLRGLDEIASVLSFYSSLNNKPDVPDPSFFIKTRDALETSLYNQQLVGSEETILGREEDKERLIDYILNPSSNQQHPIVIAVTGPGGIGKTTLVNLVCNDSRVSSGFEFVSWASYDGSLSYQHGLKRLTREIKTSAIWQRWINRKAILVSSGTLEDRLRGILQGRKFLLVVDDIEDELISEWKEYLALLKVGSAGSTVILIAWSSIETGGSTKSFELEGISERECWSLFKADAAFDGDSNQTDSSLKYVGQSIVRKCGGSPLAVKTLASLLRNNKDRHYWEQINQSKLWGQGNEAWTAWCISLTLLPVELILRYATSSIIARSNFVYRDKLVWFWMAQGLLQSTEENDDLRDIGRRFRDELESLMFLPFYPIGYLSTPICLLGRHFAECLLGEGTEHVKGHILPSRKMHVMWTEDELVQNIVPMVSLISPNKSRTFLFRWSEDPGILYQPFLERLISHMKHLRVLLLDYSGLEKLPKSIGNLKLLRYLSLAGNRRLKVLPDSLCKLVNLQTLDLSRCEELKVIPRHMHKLVSMRHLLLSVKLNTLPEKAFKSWTSLHHLKICDCQCLSSLGKGIENLTVLRTLQIDDCPSIVSLPNSINSLTSLKEFSILNCDNVCLTGWRGLFDLRSLKSLQITGLPKLLKLPDGLQSAADSLEHLVISHCENLVLTEWKGLLDLKSLKSLRIQGLPKLLELPNGLQSAADSLEHLVISHCENLRMLPESLKHCTFLVDIIILRCPKLLALPQGFHALKNLQMLTILHCPNLVQRCEKVTGDDWHLISHIPIIYLDHEVIQNRVASIVQEQPGTLNLSPSDEIRSASTISPSEIIPVPEEDHRVSITHFSHPSKCDALPAAELQHLDSVEHSHPLHPYGMNIDVQPESIPVTCHPDTGATGLENRGASSNEELFGKQVLELEKEMEGKGILYLFGNGYEFKKEMLIQLWMALGLLTDEPMEVIGANFFEKLVSKGYIACSVANSLYKVNTEELNTESDMIIDKQNYIILDNGSRNEVASTETLHVSVVCDEIDKTTFKTLRRFSRLKTLLFLGNYGSQLQQVPRDLFLCYGSLLALDLSGTHIKELPSSANKMICLRYLDLSWTFIKLLPESIDRFKKLQTLKLKGCSRLHRLPEEMKGLTELRHLDLDVLAQLATFPEGMGALVNLRTLSAFPIGTGEGLRISELKHLNNLTGEFCIANLENVQSANEAKDASLTNKKSIKMLELRWSDYQLQEPKNDEESILKNLCPHSDMEEIQILCYPGTSFPEWIADASFQELVRITLFKCEHVSMLPSLGKLPSLKSLNLVGLNSVRKMDCRGELDNAAFPMLQKLAVDEMRSLDVWIEAQEGDYPCLTELRIKDCAKLPELPSLLYLPSLKHLELSGCDNLAFVSEEELSSSLQQLIVEDCPLIKQRCSEQGGQDRHKIYHVPNIWIDQEACETYEDDSDFSEEYDYE